MRELPEDILNAIREASAGKPEPERERVSPDAPKIKCPFCSADWSESNVKLFDLDAGDHCESGRFYQECCTVSIVCHACDREMYRKEGTEIGY